MPRPVHGKVCRDLGSLRASGRVLGSTVSEFCLGFRGFRDFGLSVLGFWVWVSRLRFGGAGYAKALRDLLAFGKGTYDTLSKPQPTE